MTKKSGREVALKSQSAVALMQDAREHLFYMVLQKPYTKSMQGFS